MNGDRDRSMIAVVGFSFRLPGGTNEALWQSLLAGRDLVTQVDADRWGQDAFLHPNKSEPGRSYTFAAGSIGDVAGFDAGFFGISPREAEQMDPQQRVLLELTWESFEQAGIPPSAMRGSRCGVYVGLSSIDYAYRRADDLAAIDATTMTGNASSIAANRLSYVFDLRGPSMTIDTACSSALVAFHQACQSIRAGETDAALAAGISLHLHPYAFIGFSKASMLSPRGRCRVFDSGGDGYVRSEGGGVVLLKPLEQALADGNRIHAVVAATGVNTDGRKAGLTVPSHEAQAELLRDVYTRAGIAPAEIDYFEAHGTGTAVGDPLETRAIGEAIGRRRPPDRPLPIGSIKGNIGHLEAAAGMAGLYKVLNVLRDRRVPGNIHVEKVNPNIDLAGWNLAPVTQPLDLPARRRLVVGVSAFGFGGANAHAVLLSHDDAESGAGARSPAPPPTASLPPLLLSARSAAALRDTARAMAGLLRTRSDLSFYDIAWTAAHHREVHALRLAACGADREAIARALDEFAAGGTASRSTPASGIAPGVLVGRHRPDASSPAFVYSGNGSQWAGMGTRLLEEDAVFREAMHEVDALYAARGGLSLLDELRAPSSEHRFSLTEVAQPALFAIQVALTRTLERRGVSPIAVCGHSVGEVAAAWASGALTLEHAVRVIHERSSKQGRTRGQGCMTAVTLSSEEVADWLKKLKVDEKLCIAAFNSARAVTVAGDTDAMTVLEAALRRHRIAHQRLALDYAFHSPSMDPIRAELLRALRGLETRAAGLPMYSSVTGDRVGPNALDAAYWWRNVRAPVRFDAAIRAMVDAGINTFIEIGPRAVLTGYLAESTRPLGSAAQVLPSLTRKEAGAARLAELALELELSGGLKDRGRLFPVAGRCVELPHYPWQRERHWHPCTSESTGRLERRIVHPLLGYALAGEPLHFENAMDLARLPLCADHAVGGAAVFPAAGFVEMALAAGREHRRIEGKAIGAMQVIEDLEIVAPLLLDADQARTVRLNLDAPSGRFTIASRERLREDPWRTHVTGRLVEDCAATWVAPLEPLARAADVTAEAHYEFARTLGLDYGPAFRAVTAVWYRREGVAGAMATPAAIEPELADALLHPSYLDGAFQLLADLALRDQRESVGRPGVLPAFLPVRIERLELLQPGTRITSALAAPADPEPRSRRSLRAHFMLYDASERPVAVAFGARFQAAALKSADAPAPRWITTRAVPMPRRNPDRAIPLPGIDELAWPCAERLHTPARRHSRERFSQEVEPLLDVLCASFAERALREIAGDRPIKPEALLDAGLIAPSSLPALNGLLRILTEDEVLEPGEGQWLWRERVHLPHHEEIWMSLITDYPEYATLTARVGAAGLHLAERLRAGVTERGAAPGRQESGSTWADGCTQQEAVEFTDAAAQILRCAAAAKPTNVRLRVLRYVGDSALDGLPLVPALDADSCDVVIGAAAQSVLDDLRGRGGEIDAYESLVVDLDRDPSLDRDPGEGEQQATPRFDLIVLGEGLADAPDAARRLRNARRLLLDDGRLVVLERHPSRAADLVFGLEPTWWHEARGAAGQAAIGSRLSVPNSWRELLLETGFAASTAVHDLPHSTTGPYLLIAQADRPIRSARAVEPAAVRTWLIARDSQGYSADLGTALASALVAAGQRVVTAVAAARYGRIDAHHGLDLGAASDWERLLGELEDAGQTPDGWIHLAGLDLDTAEAGLDARTALQETRTAILAAWLQSCDRCSLRAESWVVGAHAGTALLPPAARDAVAARATRPIDRLRDAPLWGLTRVAMQEFAEQRVRWLDVHDPHPARANAARIVAEVLEPDGEDEVLLTAAGRYVPRLCIVPPPRPPALTEAQSAPPHIQLDSSVPGAFRNLTWRRASRPTPPGADEVDIEVRAAGLNFRDVMYAMGLLPDDAVENGFCGATLGMEVAGIVTAVGSAVSGLTVGETVIAFAPASFANHVRTRALAVARKPDHWSFAAAATVPTAFFTAYYALHELARLREGERVLIHGAAGGVGIAAIQLARHVGAEIFATAGTDAKRDVVRLLGADHVFDSRSLAFADEVMRASGGGVDVVLNSLAGDAIARNLRLLRPFGRMLELGKRDFYEDSRIGLRPLRNNISYFGIDADQLLSQRPDLARRVFAELMQLFAGGALTPLPHRTFDAADIATAFRHMQASRHIGKVVVTFAPDFAPLAPPRAEPKPIANAAGTYLITGGLSGLGLATARWLVRHGARHLALLSRRGAADTPGAAAALAELAAAGVSVVAPVCDVADRAALARTLDEIDAGMPPLRGVVHAAMVIEDALVRDMSRDQLERVLAPKVRGALALHDATRARELDFFVLYSSATTLFGNPGQGAYVAANMALEALAEERRAQGLPAACIGLGPIADTGYLARNERIQEALLGRMGGSALKAEDALDGLATLLAGSVTSAALMDLDWRTLGRSLPAARAPKFSVLARSAGADRAATTESVQDLRRRLLELDAAALTAALTEIVQSEVAAILRIAPERIEPHTSLLDMGMDSLMAVELAAAVEARLEVRLSALALSGSPSVDSVVERVARLLRPTEARGSAEPAAEALAEEVRAVAAQHVADLSAENAAEFSAEMSAELARPALSLTAGRRP